MFRSGYCAVKYIGGSITIWRCLGGNKLGSLVKIEGKLNKEDYLKILKENAIWFRLNVIGSNFVFQQEKQK